MAFLEWAFLALTLCGCTTLFFQPSRTLYTFVYTDQLRFEDLRFKSADQTELHAWHFSSAQNRELFPEFTHFEGPTRGLVIQFHGNAQNMTTHYRGLAWLLFEGYDLVTFDYRSYGESQGERSMAGIFQDTQAALDLALRLSQQQHLPIIAYGQSLGGSLLLRAVSEPSAHWPVQAMVIESSFASYQQIAREKLKLTWVTWPFQWLAWMTINDHYAPDTSLLAQVKIPTVFIYGEDDEIVPAHHGKQLYDRMTAPKEFWLHPYPGHINSMWVAGGFYRTQLVETWQKLK